MGTNVFTPKVKLDHLISFSDALFAFAITLTILSIDIPDLPPDLTQSELADELINMYPQVESYLISFFIIAIFWVSYHHVFNHIKGSHISIVYLNLIFLLLITLLSLSTSLVIEYNSYQIPYIIYCIIVIMTSTLLAIIWWYSTKDFKFVDNSINPLFLKGIKINLISIPVVFLAAIAISFVSIDMAQYLWLAIIPIDIIIRRKYRH